MFLFSYLFLMMSPRRDLTLSEKREILKKFDALPKCSQRVASKVLGISQSSLSCILQKRDAITTEVYLSGNVDRKRRRSGKGSVVEHVLLDWYHKAREKNEPISRSILKKKAEELAKEYHLDNFKATDGWLFRWKRRNNIVLRRYDAEVILARSLIPESISSVLADYAPNQIYNTDITVLPIYECISSEKGKEQLTQLTTVLACNMVGDKKIPLVIGKSEFLSDFKEEEIFPVQCKSSEDGFVTREIFVSFLLEWDKTLDCENIVLLLGDSYIHLDNVPLKNINMIFLPTSVISIIQPLDQGIVESFKSLYAKNLQIKVKDNDIDGKGSVQTTKGIALLDIFHIIAKSWLNVTSTCIYNCFIKAGLNHKHDHLGFNTVKEKSVSNTTFDLNSTAWLNSFKSVVSEQSEIVASKQSDESISENIDENTISDKATESTISDRGDENVENSSDNSDVEIEKYLEQSLHEGKPVTSKETYSALTIIRKTLEQRGASLMCYELFYKMENEISKLLQKPA